MGETRAYNLGGGSCRALATDEGGILWLMRDNNIKWTVNKYTSTQPWARVAPLPGKRGDRQRRRIYIYIYTQNALSRHMSSNVFENYSAAICDGCVCRSSYWQALILHGSSGMCYWLRCWMGSLCVKGQFLMPYLDKLYFKVPAIIYHALWVIRL